MLRLGHTCQTCQTLLQVRIRKRLFYLIGIPLYCGRREIVLIAPELMLVHSYFASLYFQELFSLHVTKSKNQLIGFINYIKDSNFSFQSWVRIFTLWINNYVTQCHAQKYNSTFQLFGSTRSCPLNSILSEKH